MFIMRPGASRLHACLIVVVLQLLARSAVTRAVEAQGSSWPACAPAAPSGAGASLVVAQSQEITRINLPATSHGCTLMFAAEGSTPGPAAAVQRLAPNALIAGAYDGTVGRPPAVRLRTVEGAGQGQLLLSAGGNLVLQDLLLSNVTLQDPQKSPSLALLPADLQLPAGTTLQLIDVKMIVSQAQLQDYIVYMMEHPQIIQWTDGVSFLHIRQYSSELLNGSASTVEGSTITLLAPEGARYSNTPLPVLQELSQQAPGSSVDSAELSAARGDQAGIVTVTDSYVLGATNSTLVKLIQQLAGQQETKSPLLIFIATNVTLDPAAGGQEWPPGGVKIKRPVIWVGSSWRNTSIDFHMEVGQFVLQGSSANVTLVNLVLENLAYGDELSARDAEGKSLSRSHILWSFRFRRSQPRTVLWDDVMVFPEQIQVDNAAYWSDAFNSDLDFWKNQTAFMRDPLGIQVQKYKRGKNPGEYIMTIVKKDQLMTNVTYTSRPYVAKPLPLIINPTLHSDIVNYRADPGVGPVYTREDVAVTLYNVRRGGCQRMYILLPTAPNGGVINWGPAELAFNATHPVAPMSYQDPSESSIPQPLRASQLSTNTNSTNSMSPASAAVASDNLAQTWPSPGGELVRCPVQFRGVSSSDQPTTVIDLGFVQGLFRLDPYTPGVSGPQAAGSPGSQAAAAPLPTQAGTTTAGRAPVLQFGSLVFRCLPQGIGFGGISAGEVADSAGNGTAGRSAGATAPAAPSAPGTVVGGVGSGVPAEAYTHLLWFITRDLTGSSLVALANVTLYVPPAEAAAMGAAARQAISTAGSSDAAVLSMVYPTENGPLPVVYRYLWFTEGPSYASAGDYASLFVGRRMLQLPGKLGGTTSTAGAVSAAAEGVQDALYHRRLLQISSTPGAAAEPTASSATAAVAPSTPVKMLCIGSLEGLGLSGRNICMVAQEANVPLPPGYLWPATSGTASSSWGPWKAAVVAICVAIAGVAVIAGFLVVRRRRMRKRMQQHLSNTSKDTDTYSSNRTMGNDNDGKIDVLSSSSNHRDQLSGSHRAKSSAAAAALAAAEGLLAASSASSDTLRRLAQRLEQASGGAADTTDSASSVAAAGAGSQGKDTDVAQFETAVSKGATMMAGQLQKEPSVTVGLGEELGRLAAIHHSLLSYAAADEDEQDAERARARLQQAQAGAALAAAAATVTDPQGAQKVDSDEQQFKSASSLQQQPSTIQRLSSAITAVSAEMHMRRLGGRSPGQAASPSEAAAASSTVAAVAQGADLSSRAAGAAVGASQPQQQSGLSGPSDPKPQQGGPPVSRESSGSSSGGQQTQHQQQLQLHEVIGSGTFGVVYRATWRGIPAAVKVMQLPAGATAGQCVSTGLEAMCSRREQMAVMETALGSSLSHPNIVQVYTYHLRPLGQSCKADDLQAPADGSSAGSAAAEEAAASLMKHSNARKGSGGSSGSTAVTGYELQLVMEYCPLGSLRAAIDNCLLEDRLTGRPQYLTVLSLALGVARAMHHMHSEGVLHGDLKAGNVLLKMEVVSAAAAGWSGPIAGVNATREVLVSKVADFGLACRISDQDTHISGVHRGTLSHMSPELLVHGHASRGSDVYAMGILLWEMATGLKAFAGTPKAMLGAAVVRDRARPAWPSSSTGSSHLVDAVQPPLAYRQLAERCWAHEPQDRPTFAEITTILEALLQDAQQQLVAITQAPSQTHYQQQFEPSRSLPPAQPAVTAGGAHRPGALEAVKRLLGPAPSSMRQTGQVGPATPAPAQGPAGQAAALAPWAKRQRSVSFADSDSPADSPTAAPAPAKANGSSKVKRQGAPSPAGSAGHSNPSSNGQTISSGTPQSTSSGINGAGEGFVDAVAHRKAALAAVAAVLQEPAGHGNGAWLAHGLSNRLFSVQEEVAEEQVAEGLASTDEAAEPPGPNGTAQEPTAWAAAAANPSLPAGSSRLPAGGTPACAAGLCEITPAGPSGGSPFDALKCHPWK